MYHLLSVNQESWYPGISKRYILFKRSPLCNTGAARKKNRDFQNIWYTIAHTTYLLSINWLLSQMKVWIVCWKRWCRPWWLYPGAGPDGYTQVSDLIVIPWCRAWWLYQHFVIMFPLFFGLAKKINSILGWRATAEKCVCERSQNVLLAIPVLQVLNCSMGQCLWEKPECFTGYPCTTGTELQYGAMINSMDNGT